MPQHYDIAVLGGGLAGLSFLYHLVKADRVKGKSIVLVDPETHKTAHDRTWSFWEREPGPFEHLVYHRWDTVTVHNSMQDLTCPLGEFTYKLIRSTEFYAYVNKVIDASGAVERIAGRAENIESSERAVNFTVGNRSLRAEFALSSLPLHLRPRKIKPPYLDQHFRGWFINTETPVFDPGTAALMDFRTPQCDETRFFYVLPFSPRRAMVEVAIFSNNHLEVSEYDALIEGYLREYWTRGGYEIEHRESGNIPMTTYPFPLRDGNLIYIGLRGGAARPSTGYTFYGLQRQLREMAADFPRIPQPWRKRDLLYDATILRILQEGTLPGDRVFVDLFARNPTPRLLDFLNGESTFAQELALMSTTNISAFGSTFVREALK